MKFLNICWWEEFYCGNIAGEELGGGRRVWTHQSGVEQVGLLPPTNKAVNVPETTPCGEPITFWERWSFLDGLAGEICSQESFGLQKKFNLEYDEF